MHSIFLFKIKKKKRIKKGVLQTPCTALPSTQTKKRLKCDHCVSSYEAVVEYLCENFYESLDIPLLHCSGVSDFSWAMQMGKTER